MTVKNSFEFVRIILHSYARPAAGKLLWKSLSHTGRQRETMEKMFESHESFVIYVHGELGMELGRLVISTNFVPPTKL